MANKLAVVTGASSGIGLSLAKELASRGYDLIVASAGERGVRRRKNCAGRVLKWRMYRQICLREKVSMGCGTRLRHRTENRKLFALTQESEWAVCLTRPTWTQNSKWSR